MTGNKKIIQYIKYFTTDIQYRKTNIDIINIINNYNKLVYANIINNTQIKKSKLQYYNKKMIKNITKYLKIYIEQISFILDLQTKKFNFFYIEIL